MLDIRYIRDNRDLLQMTADKKGVKVSIAELIRLDDCRRRLRQEVDELRQERNRLSAVVGQWIRNGESDRGEEAKQAVRMNNEQRIACEKELQVIEMAYERIVALVPNPVSADTPEGNSDADNLEIRRIGEPPVFDFEPKDHVELGNALGILDIPRAVKVAGTRNYVLKGAGFHLHRAVQQLAMDLLEKRGFTPMDVPLLVREETLVHTGFFPFGRDQNFALAEEDRYLIGTSEVSLVSYFANEIVDVQKPIRLAAVSSCFRSEIGSAGRDVRGLYRVHQFAKVEQVVFCENDPELSEQILQEMTANAEEILQLLELPYRVVAVCIGNMSPKTHKQYDVETWMPSRQAYGETHSASNLHDFQARRANIRYRDAQGKTRYCHSLNNTAVATPRILIPLLENHQREDGSIYIPRALRPYMNGIQEIRV